MADPLSIASATLAIVTATIQASKLLYQTVHGFNNHQRNTRQLLDELIALRGVLESLQDLSNQEGEFPQLKVPLLQCCQACTEFGDLLSRCSKHGDGSKASLRDWARFKYMDSDVRGFTDMLAGYKATVAIAVADANL